MFRLFIVCALVSSVSIYITLAVVAPATARDIGIIYAVVVATGSLALNLDTHWRRDD